MASLFQNDKNVEIQFKLHAAQLNVFNDKHRFQVLVAGRQFGKSTLAVARTCCSALEPNNKDRKPVLLVAPTHPQAKFLYWRPLLDKLHPLIESSNSNEGLIYLNNGVAIAVKGADNPDSLRGPGWYDVILDEYANMKPFVWGEIIRPALSYTKGRAMFIGTPAGRNHFYKLATHAASEKDNEWAFFHHTSYDNPFLSESEIEAMRGSMSSGEFQQEVMASFDTGGGNHFKQEELIFSSKEPKDGAYVVTVDLAGFTGEEKTKRSNKMLDQHCICVTKVTPNGDWWVKRVEIGRWGVKECARRIVDVILEVEPVSWGIERGALYNAVLPYILDEAKGRGKFNVTRPVPLTHENRIKTERILWALQGRIQHGRIKFNEGPWNRHIEDQLLHFPSTMVHDDIPDALAYVEQLTRGQVFYDVAEIDDTSYWKPTDPDVGL